MMTMPNSPSTNSTRTPFKIEHIEFGGKGVSKKDPLLFIPKTLPEEEGHLTHIKKARGVHFGFLQNPESDITVHSKKRIPPSCQHFNECSGCHYLHTDYDEEIQIKKSIMTYLIQQKLVSKEGFQIPDINVIKAKKRLHYRNRIQLHYNLKQKKIGLINPILQKIVEVPHCQIVRPQVAHEIQKLYSDDFWISKAKTYKKNQGHVEIYIEPETNRVFTTWNQSYAFGGFSQVNQDMNQTLVEKITSIFHNSQINHDQTLLLDLFSGKGNLTQKLNPENILHFDIQVPQQKNFFQYDLYQEKNLEKIHQRCLTQHKMRKEHIFLLDPPRKGFPLLKSFSQTFPPELIIYVSCNIHTALRDIQTLSPLFSLEQIEMLDMFPSTYHFESIFVLRKK